MLKPSCATSHAARPHTQQSQPEVSHSRTRWRRLSILGCPVQLCVLFLLLGGAHATAWAQPTSTAPARLEYLFLPASGARADTDSLQGRFAPPAGTERVSVAPRSFAAWLRELLPTAAPLLRLPLHITADRLLGGSGVAGAAASSTAGNSAAVPQAIALADPTYAAIASAATVQVTAAVIVTAILTPLLTSWWYRRTPTSAPSQMHN